MASKMEKHIFTFWEPEENMPGYIRLCMRTWEKNLPDYTVVNCTYKNLPEYLPADILEKILYKKMSLPKQSDCLRAWLMAEHGGIWMDADTIVTGSGFFDEIKDKECCMIGNTSAMSPHGAFIYAQRNAEFVRRWADEIPYRVARHRKVYRFPLKLFYKIFHREEYNTVKKWDYFGNSITDPLAKTTDKSHYTLIERNDIYALPEYFAPFYKHDCDPVALYRDFYFKDYDFNEILEKNRGVILLHNSWTPPEYKKMSETEFLAQDVTMAKMLKHLLAV